jgi:Putative phage tail protein
MAEFAVWLGTEAAIAGVGLGVTNAQILGTTLLIAHSARTYRQSKKLQESSIKDVMTPVRSSAPERAIVYGRTRVSGPVIYHTTYGTNQESLAMTIALAGHELTAIDEVWFNDASIGTLDGGGAVQAGSLYYKSTPYGQATHSWTGGGANSTEQLPVQYGLIFGGLDTLVYVTPVVSIIIGLTGGDQQEQYVSGGETVQLVVNTDYTVSGTGLVTLLNTKAQGSQVVATYRMNWGVPFAACQFFLGAAAGERDTWLESNSNGEWTSDMIGELVARIRVNLTWDETIYAQGLPQVSCVVRGAKIYDPRQDSTNGGTGAHRADTYSTWTYSNNSALVAVDFLRRATHEGGFGALSTEIDWTSVIAAANACAEPVALSGTPGDTQERFQTDAVLFLGDADTRQENLQTLLAAFDGIAYWSGGKWYVRAAVVATSVISVDETDLAGGEITLKSKLERRETYNAVRGRYRDPLQKYAVTDFPPYESSAYVTEDNGQTIWKDIDLPSVSHAVRAQRLAKQIMHRARQAVTFEANWKLGLYKVQPGDGVTVTLARYGWSGKLFRVLKREFVSLNVVKLTLQEDAAAVYSWSYTEQTNVDPAPNTQLARANQVANPVSFTLTSSEDTIRVSADGTIIPYVRATWAAPTTDDAYTEVFWKRTSDTTFRKVQTRAGATECVLEPVSGGDRLNVQAVHVNALGARSVPVVVTPYYEVSALLPKFGESPPASANLVPNSTFETGAQRWAFTGVWGGPTGTGRIDPPSYHNAAFTIPGPVRNAVATVSSEHAGNDGTAAWQSENFSVTPGETMVAFAELHCVGTNAAAGVAFYTTTGTYVGELFGTLIDKDPDGNALEWAVPSNYTVSRVRGTVPAGAQVGRFTVWASTGWWANLQKYVSIFRPFAGAVDPTSTLYPVWTASGSGVTGSPGILPGAVTETYNLRWTYQNPVVGPVPRPTGIQSAPPPNGVAWDANGDPYFYFAVQPSANTTATQSGVVPAGADAVATLTIPWELQLSGAPFPNPIWCLVAVNLSDSAVNDGYYDRVLVVHVEPAPAGALLTGGTVTFTLAWRNELDGQAFIHCAASAQSVYTSTVWPGGWLSPNDRFTIKQPSCVIQIAKR